MKPSLLVVNTSGSTVLTEGSRFIDASDGFEILCEEAQSGPELCYSDESLPLAEIVSRRATIGAFANGQRSLVQRLENNFHQLLTLFSEYESQRTVFIIGELFMSTNTDLLVKVAEDSHIMDVFVDILSRNETDLDMFRAGITARIIANALQLWPQQIFEQIFRAQTMLSTLLTQGTVTTKWLLETITRACDEQTSSFLWGFFLALFDGSVSAAPPAHWDVSSDSFFICADMKLDSSQRILLYRLFAIFLNRLGSTATGEQLKEDLFVSIPELLAMAELPERGEILGLAVLVPPSTFFVDVAFEVLEADLCSPAAEKAVAYLAANSEYVPVGKAIWLFHKLLHPPEKSWGEKNSFVINEAWKLMDQLRSKSAHRKFFSKAMEHVIAYSWNRRPTIQRLACNACLLGYSLAFIRRATWGNWFDFCNLVVRSFRDQVRWNDGFMFDENAWDTELMQRILSGAKEFELPPEDSIAFVAMKSSGSFADHLSESASRASMLDNRKLKRQPSQQAFAPKRVRAMPRGVKERPRAHTPGPTTSWLL